MTAGIVISLVMLSLWLAWLWNSGEIRSMSFESKARNLVIWAIIIGVLTFVLSRFGV